MRPGTPRAELFARLDELFTGEALFDGLANVVYFIKNARGQYVVVNQTLVERCGLAHKNALIGKTPDEVFPFPLGKSYRTQDEVILSTGEPILNRLELHLYPSGETGWCLTNKVALRGRHGEVVGLVGISRDLRAPSSKSEEFARLAEVIQYIQSHYGETLNVRQLAKRADLSVYQFEQRIGKLFEITAGEFIQKVRMDAAVRLLRETDHPIAKIALECGYSDQSAFTRQFRQTIRVSPSHYRRLSRE
jgi:AraC-like DNA-binding protein